MTESKLEHDPSVREYVAFRLADQDFCIDISAVREIRGWSPTTPMPRTPDYISGLINLRGTVIPILDLSLRFGFCKTETTPRHVIIVVQIDNQSVGLLVDGVSDILTVSADSLQPTPEVGADPARAFVSNVIASEDGRMIRLVDLSQVAPARIGAAA